MFSFKQPKKPAPTPKKPTEKRALSFGARHQLENSAIHRSGSIQNELDRVRSLGPILHAVGPAEFGLTALGQQAVEHAVGGALEVEPRIHHDAAATGFARAFSARAIAHGADIFVSPRDTGEKPADDRTVLSHELAHTVERSPVSAVPHLSRFEGGEHMYLGDSGWDSATKLLIDQLVEKEVAGIQDPQERVRKAQKKRAELEHVFRNRLEGKSTKKFSYGAGVGLAGDHFETAHDMMTETGLHWTNNAVDVIDMVEIFEAEQAGVEQGAIGENYEEATLAILSNSGEYLDLAKKNHAHFSVNNLQQYIENHNEALILAAKAHGQSSAKLFEKAKFKNAFADHFLTDMFAAGHMRTPRAEIESYLRDLGYNTKNATGATKFVHDYDNIYGLPVKNARGDRWTAYGDKYLHADQDADRADSYRLLDEPSKTGKDVAVEATAMSIYEVIGTYAQGIKSVTPFAALEYVPFIDQARLKEDLSDIFSVYNDSKGRREHMKLSGGLMRVVDNDVMDVMVRNFDRFEMWAHANNKEHINLERAFVHAPKELVRGLLAVHGRWELGAGRDAEAIHEIAQGRLTSAEDKEIRLIVESNPQAWVLYEATYPEDDLWDDLSDDTQDLIRALVPSGFSKIIEGAQNYGGGGADE